MSNNKEKTKIEAKNLIEKTENNTSSQIPGVNNQNSLHEENIDDKNNYFLRTIKNTSFFVVISLITKILNLVINIFVIRKITKKTFGIAKIYFESSFLMLQYFPLETMRKTTQKYCCGEKDNVENIRFEQCSRITWLLNIIFIFLTIPIWYIYVTYGENLSDVKFQMFLHLFCANLELFVEPILLYCNIKFYNNYKLAVITLSNYVKVFTTFILVIFFNLELWAFTIARILSSLIYVIYLVYISYRQLNLKTNSIFPFFFSLKDCDNLYEENSKEKKIKNKVDYFMNWLNLFNPILKEIFLSFVYINILKMILTYTEKIFLSFFIKFHESEKSEYSFVIDNFAILIRFFLEPLESNFFNLINKIKVPIEDKQNDNTPINNKNDNNIDESENDFLNKKKISEYTKNKKSTINKMMNILNLFLRFLLIFGILLVGYIYTIGKEVFMLVFGSSWATETAIVLLKNYSIYIFIISLNGILEAFGNAISNKRQMNLFNKMMVFNSIFLITFSILMNGYSVLGLIYANGLAMLLRIIGNIYIIFSESFINEQIEYEKNKLDDSSNKL